MRYLIALVIWSLPLTAWAQDWEDHQTFGTENAGATLRIISSTDTALFAPIIEDFVAQNPAISVEYMVTSTADLDRRFRLQPHTFDIVISSAMDLQLKLANDGFALPLMNIIHPSWAQWRQSLFAFTAESATIIINRQAFAGHPMPETRQDLIRILRSEPKKFYGKMGTYDIRQSGLGYLFATQDARASETFWRLMEVMGGLDVRLYCCSSDMIEDLIDGTLAVAYNVLGSYASVQVEGKENLHIIMPTDFSTTMMRTALVSQKTLQAEIAEAFIHHLVKPDTTASDRILSRPAWKLPRGDMEQSTITLEPALIIYLDALKRKKFLSAWQSAVIQN